MTSKDSQCPTRLRFALARPSSSATRYFPFAPFSAILPPGAVTTIHFSKEPILLRFALALPSDSATTYFPCQDFRLIISQPNPFDEEVLMVVVVVVVVVVVEVVVTPGHIPSHITCFSR